MVRSGLEVYSAQMEVGIDWVRAGNDQEWGRSWQAWAGSEQGWVGSDLELVHSVRMGNRAGWVNSAAELDIGAVKIAAVEVGVT